MTAAERGATNTPPGLDTTRMMEMQVMPKVAHSTNPSSPEDGAQSAPLIVPFFSQCRQSHLPGYCLARAADFQHPRPAAL